MEIMEGILEFKNNVGSVKDIDTQKRIVTGYLTAFGNKDYDGDIGTPGMFERTIRENGPNGKNTIFFLNQHNWQQPHGKFAVLKEDDKGLYFESNPLPNTTYSNDLLELYSAKIINEHSYGYITTKYQRDEDTGTRTLLEVDLYEGSNVTLGANPNTPFTGFKNLNITQINQKSADIVKMLRNGNLTDDTFIQLEIALKMLQSEAYHLGKEQITPDADAESKAYEPIINSFLKFKLT